MSRHLGLLLLATALMMASCQKEETSQWLEITAEHYGGTKLAIDGTGATWTDGETLRINATTATIHRSNGDHAYIDATASAAVNRALYPATLSQASLTSDTVTVALPPTYHYRTAGGHQQLEVPMAARALEGNPLHFQHLTGALSFTIVNSLGTALVLDSLQVESDRYALSGTRPINFSALATLAPVEAGSAADRRVAMLFDHDTLAAGDSLTVVLPIAPVDVDNHFTIRVSARHQGTRYTYSRSQLTGGALVRNQLGYARTPLSSSSTDEGPLFRFKQKVTDDNNKYYVFYIDSPKEFCLMAEAITNQWPCPVVDYFSAAGYQGNAYILTTGLDMSGASISTMGRFAGAYFDGAGYTISNLTINGRNGRCGLFESIISTTTIKKLTLSNVTLQQPKNGSAPYHVAPFVCSMPGGTLQNCHVNGLTISVPGNQGNTYYGGLVADVSGAASIESCSVDFSLGLTQTSDNMYFGALVGYAEGSNPTVTVSNCSVSVRNTTLNDARNFYYGAIVGYNSTATFYVSHATCSTYVSLVGSSSFDIRAGGFAGRLATNGVINVSSSSIVGSIEASGRASSYLGTCVGYKDGANWGTMDDESSENTTITLTLNGDDVSKLIGNQ